MLCAGVTAFSALRRAQIKPGQTVAVLGAGGGLGHIAVQIASKGMALRVIGIDHSSKKDLILSSGAEHFVGFDLVEDTVKAVKETTDKNGVDVALVLTGNNKAYGQALSMLAHNGKLVCVGVPDGDLQVIGGAFPAALIFKEISIVGSAVGNRMDAIEVLDLVARGVVQTHYSLTKMENLQDVFADMAAGKVQGRMVLDLLT
jgi:propanol-preferring alcohol dehydrogenase